MGYQLIPALTTLRAQINAAYPNRDRSSDGWVGDTSHSRRASDHNPDQHGWVHAIDVDKDGIDPYQLVNIAIADERVNYVIFNKAIFSRAYGFRARLYTGANPHDKHVHISAMHGAKAMDGRNWAIPNAVVPVTIAIKPIAVVTPIHTAEVKDAGVVALQTVLNGFGAGIAVDGVWGSQSENAANRYSVRRGAHGIVVRAIQSQFSARGWKIAVDGDFGPGTDRIVRAFQGEKRLGVDGVVGAKTYLAMWTAPR